MPTNHINNTLTLSSLAMDHLGLSKQPFESLTLSEEAIFTDAIFDQLLDTTNHHLQFSDLLLIIEGNLGSGKTTLLKRISQTETPNIRLLPIHAEATDTLTQIQEKTSIHLKDQGDANHLDDNLKHLQVFDQKPVLVIDDAHVLSDTTIQELLRYQQLLENENETTLKILLLANKGMAKTLEQISDLQHNQLYVQEMPEYTPKQILAFIQHKMKLADYNGDSIFDNDNIQTIFKKSSGSPLSIMELTVAHIEKLARKKIKASGFQLKPAILLISSIALLGIAGFIKFYLTEASLTEAPIEIVPTPDKQLQTKNLTNADEAIAQQTNTISEDVKNLPIELPEERLSKTETPIETIEAKIFEIETTQAPIKSNGIQQTEETYSSEITTDVSLPETKPVDEIKTVHIVTESQSEATPSIITEPFTRVEEKKPIIETVKLHPSLQQLSQLGVHDKSWIMEQDTNHWSLQITGARDPATLLYTAKRYKLNGNSAWYETQLTGKPWYVLIYGLYTHKDAANQAKQFLPGDLKSKKPFSKSFNSIQASVRQP